MRFTRIILALGLGLTVSACAGVDIPTRNVPFEPLPDTAVTAPEGYELTRPAAAPAPVAALAARGAAPAVAPGKSPVSVTSIIVRVPRDLKVSEANRYLPAGDIVWRGDPIGDRYAQVQQIFETAFARGTAPLDGPVEVVLDVQVRRFHALTEKARYTTGGVHSITFDMALKSARTGELLVPVRTVRADLDAFGGQMAIEADARGETQKVRITAHLAEVIRQELTNPAGYRNARLGFYQMLNNL